MKKIMMALLLSLVSLSVLFAGGKSEEKQNARMQDSQIIKVMQTDVLDSLDPQQAVFGSAFEIIADFTDGLMQVNPDGTISPAIAESEEVSDDDLTRTYTIRPDAKWSNGEPVTANDFVFGLRRAVDPAVAYEYYYMVSDIAQIKNANAIIHGTLPVSDLGIVALDEHTVQYQLAIPVPFFDSLLSFPSFYPMNEKFFESVGTSYGTSPETLLSNGAFIVTDYSPAAVRFSLRKNPMYYDADRIQLDGIDYQVLLDSQQALMSYQNGDLDMINLTGDQIDQVKDDPNFKSYNAGYLWYLQPNNEGVEALDNLNLRRAITFSIDRDSLVNNVIKDGSLPSYSIVPSALAYDTNGNDFSSESNAYPSVIGFNPQLAKEYYQKALEELGVTSISLDLLVDDASLQQNIGAVIQQTLQSTLPHFKVNLIVEPKKQRGQDTDNGNFDLVLKAWGADYADPTTYLGMFVTGNPHDSGNWSNSEYDSLIQRSMSGDLVSQPEERWKALKKAEAIAMDDVVIMPLYQQSYAAMVNPNLQGVTFHSVGISRIYKDAILTQ